MYKTWILSGWLCVAFVGARAQEVKTWTMDDCMRYAAENSLKVRAERHQNDTYRAEYRAAIADFFPSVGMRIGGQLNYGRSIDPQTNTYNNVSTFNNSYQAYASLPLFDGGQLVNRAKAAAINRQLGAHEVRRVQNEAALAVMEAFSNAVYYGGTVRLAIEKLGESRQTLHKTRRMEELGLKGAADVAQVEAIVAADDYNLIHQQNLYDAAVRTLKETMNYPAEDALMMDTSVTVWRENATTLSAEEIFSRAVTDNPTMRAAECRRLAAQHLYRVARSAMFPQLTFEAGISTNYFRNLADPHTTAFSRQFFDNNRGEYLALTLSIPLFDGLARYTSARRARNAMRVADVQRDETLRQLRAAIEQAVADRDGLKKRPCRWRGRWPRTRWLTASRYVNMRKDFRLQSICKRPRIRSLKPAPTCYKNNSRTKLNAAWWHTIIRENLFVKTKNEQPRALENDYPEKMLDCFGWLDFRFALLRGRFFGS